MHAILAAILAASMTLSGVGGALQPGSSQLASASLNSVCYPEVPVKPARPSPSEGEGDAAWQQYSDALSAYSDAMAQRRQDGPTAATIDLLSEFAQRSALQVLSEHENENAVYSPLSLWCALGLTAQCAQGDSRQQVLDALGEESLETLAQKTAQIWNGLYKDDGENTLLLANSIWLNSHAQGQYVQETLDTLGNDFYARVFAVPMGETGVDDVITAWAKEATRGLVGGNGPLVETKAEMLAVLASALYYKTGWTSTFQEANTTKDTFTAADGTETTVDFMHQTERSNFIRQESFEAAFLGTEDGNGEVVFLLPKEGVEPKALLNEVQLSNALDFSATSDEVHQGEVQWSVPKFDVSTTLDLLAALKQLGVTDLLDPEKADLSALSSAKAFLSSATQVARVKVDEKGIEAAAVTALSAGVTGMPDPDPEVCVMNLNRPFLFVVRSEGVPLFVGMVNTME